MNMLPEHKIIGNLSEQDLAEARGDLGAEHQKGLEPLEGEREKRPDELRFIEKINQYLAEEFKELGIDGTPRVLPERVHILPPDAYRKHFPDKVTAGFYDSIFGSVYLADEGLCRLLLYVNILHESLHLLSKQKWLVRRDVGADNELHFWQHRSGYRSFSSYADKREKTQHEHFQGLNEAVIDKLVLEIMRKHFDELVQELAITPEEKAEIGPYYQFEFIEVLDIIIKRLAESMQVSEREIWKKFARGLFTGEMMHLREVERFFGKDALRVLGALGDPELTPFSEKVIQQVKRYFEIDDQNERGRIAKQLEIMRAEIL
jgi:hypothetical protein